MPLSTKAIVDAYQSGPGVVKALIFIGAFVVLNHLSFLLQVFYKRFLRPAKNLRKYGQWGKFKFTCMTLS